MRRKQICCLAASVVIGVFTAVVMGQAQSKQPPRINISEYVPIDNGRTWTYEWRLRTGDGTVRKMSRTRSFEGPEFLSTGYAYKLVSDLGDYVLLSVENNQLLMHGTVEPHRSIRFIFDPPIVLFSPDMEFGKPYQVTQHDINAEGMQTWTTVGEGFEDIETPMGRFRGCLKIRLEMETDGVRTKAVYYYAKGMGLVVYQYESWVDGKERPAIETDARLKLAQVGGQMITSSSQLEALRSELVASSARFDDELARKLFRHAFERLYFWPLRFPGFQADFTLHQSTSDRGSEEVLRGSITVGRDFKMKLRSGNRKATHLVETELSQVITHLKHKTFDAEFDTAIFSVGDRDPEQGIRVDVSGDGQMGTSYRVKGDLIKHIGHSYGRVRFVIDHTQFLTTDDGRQIATAFTITYYSNETNQIVDQVRFQDEYVKVDNIWLLKKRRKTETAKGKTSTLVVEFADQTTLK